MFSLVLVVQARPQFRVMSVGKGFFFRTFPRLKKSEVRRDSESEGSSNVVVRRHTGETSMRGIPNGCRHGKLIWSVYGVKGLASLDPFLGAPAISGAGERYRSCGSHCGAVRVRISADLDRRSLLSDGLSCCRLQVESAWSFVLSRSPVARRPLVRMAVVVVCWLD